MFDFAHIERWIPQKIVGSLRIIFGKLDICYMHDLQKYALELKELDYDTRRK